MNTKPLNLGCTEDGGRSQSQLLRKDENMTLRTIIAEIVKAKKKEIVNEFYNKYCLYIFNVDRKKRDIKQIRKICTPFKSRLLLIVEKFIDLLIKNDTNYIVAGTEENIDYALRFVVPAKDRDLKSNLTAQMVRDFQCTMAEKILSEINLSKKFVCEEKILNILNESTYIIFNDLWMSSVVGFRYQHSIIQKLLAKLIKAQEEERQKLCEQIHDRFLQSLALIPLKLEIIEKLSYCDLSTMRKELKWLTEMVVNTIGEVRNLVTYFRFSWTEKRGLAFSLQELSRRFERDFKIPVHLNICKTIGKYKGYAAVTLFRII